MNGQTKAKKITCKYCGSSAIKKFGTYKGQRRYFCNDCERKFKADDCLFHGKVPSSYSSQAVADFYRGDSLIKIGRKLSQKYGYRPSKSVIWKWIKKYTDLAIERFEDAKPEVGSLWVADETEIDLRGLSIVWVYNVIDLKTRYLLASRVSISRAINAAEVVMREAQKNAGRTPLKILTDPESSFEALKKSLKSCGIEHKPPYILIDTNKNNAKRVERYHGSIKDRDKIVSAFKYKETFTYFNEGWLVYHNYLRPQQSLKGKTPAEAAGIQYDVKNWADIAQMPL